MKKFCLYVYFVVGILSGVSLHAQVEVPKEELAREAVLPSFENSVAVKSRIVTTANKFEVGAYYGWNFSEPIYNQAKVGANLGYHWNEYNALIVNLGMWQSGINQYGQQLYSSMNLDFNRAPKINYSLWANYEMLSYYGKISLTKQGVMNLSLYPILGLGVTAYEHKNYYGANAGVGWKFYFSPGWALRMDLKLQYAGGPSPFLKGSMKTTDPVPSSANFVDKWTLSSLLDIGIIAMF